MWFLSHEIFYNSIITLLCTAKETYLEQTHFLMVDSLSIVFSFANFPGKVDANLCKNGQTRGPIFFV